MRLVTSAACLLLTLLAAACGPSVSDGSGAGEGDGPDAADDQTAPVDEYCGNNLDDDDDGAVDCDDADCRAGGECVVEGCGELEQPEASLALPDGVGTSYESTLDFTGFSDGQTLDDIGALLGICVNMEHSWLRDLQIEASCPDGRTVVLQQFMGREIVHEVHMGQPNDGDGTQPTPGVGAEYCWTPGAPNPPTLTYANQHQGSTLHLPPGDYQSIGALSDFVGCSLNGGWSIKVTDLWASDNGFIFTWAVKFDAAIVEDCSDWPID